MSGAASDCMLGLVNNMEVVSDMLQGTQFLVTIASNMQYEIDDHVAASFTDTYAKNLIGVVGTSRAGVNRTLGLGSCAAVPLIVVKAQQILALLSQIDATLRSLDRRIQTALPASFK